MYRKYQKKMFSFSITSIKIEIPIYTIKNIKKYYIPEILINDNKTTIPKLLNIYYIQIVEYS